ncbi:MAG: cysteine desulfurase [Candidatus Solibacter usitatus]|nr:cysteine desulfurase [Candidatus Solibacter usitatus]
MQARYYFDHNATTPVCEEALRAHAAALRDVYGNASSIHHYGQAAKQALEKARKSVASLIGATPKEIVFTSGGTESNNLALFGAVRAGAHIITTTIEHPAVLGPCRKLQAMGVDVTFVAPDADGVVDPAAVRREVRSNTALISVMHVNNETGVIQPVEEMARIAHEANALFHVDGVQAAGRIPVDVAACGIDLYSISAHKLYAPKGVGALYIRKGVELSPLLHGGRQEKSHRAGTENVPAAMAFAAAADWARENAAEAIRLSSLRDRLEASVLAAVPQARVNGRRGQRVANTSSIRFDGIEGEAIVIALDLRGFAISSGSACSSGAVEPSHVLLAMGLSGEQARSSVRISLGRDNTVDQVDALSSAIADSVARLRKLSPVYAHA